MSDLLRLAFWGVLRDNIRLLVSVLSVAIGVFAVSIFISIGITSKNLVEKQLDGMGMDGILVFAKEDDFTFTESQVEELEQSSDNIDSAMGVVTAFAGFKTSEENGNALLLGVDENLDEVMSIDVLHGSLFEKEQIKGRENVIVVEDTLAIEIYGRENIVGREISLTINRINQKFEVIGVIKSQKGGLQSLSYSIPTFIYMPSTKVIELTGDSEISQIFVSSSDKNDSTIIDIEEYFNTKPQYRDAIEVSNIGQYTENISSITVLITAFIVCVAGISLLVALIGVCGVMLMSANGRKKEIGIYIALGIENRDIKKCFILESAIICTFGGIVGSLLSALCILLVNSRLNLTIEINFAVFVIMTVLSAIGGMIAGLIPAYKAMKNQVIFSLRDI